MKKLILFVAAALALAVSCDELDFTNGVFNFEKDLIEQTVPYDANTRTDHSAQFN